MDSTKTYKVIFSKKAEKQLAKLDHKTGQIIFSWVMTNLNNCTDPRAHGKALVGDHSGEWRYRVGDYRILAVIHDDTIVIEVFKIAHRKEVY